jgi:hypothetical protein
MIVAALAPDIPKIIWSLWLQGREEAPDLVRLNFDRWTRLSPDYRLEILDQRDVDALFKEDDLAIADQPVQVLSDVVRARLLCDHGGIWADAALFPVRPLDDWLPDTLNSAGLFAFERPRPDRLIASWFLVASKHSPIFRELWGEIKRFWSKPRQLVRGIPADPIGSVSPDTADTSDTYPYFWFHYLFEYVVRSRPEAAAQWNACVRLPADAGHRMQFLFAGDANPSEAEIQLAANAAPVQKLNWRTAYPRGVLNALS